MSADALDRIHFSQLVTSGDHTTATRLVAAIASAREELKAYQAPTMGTRFDLQPGETVSDYDDGRAPLVLICPWCHEDVQQDALHDLEISERWTYASEIDSDERVVTFSHDSSGDHDSITFIHDGCGLPVELPDDWEWATT